MWLGVTSYAFTWEIGVPGYEFPIGAPVDAAAVMGPLGLLDRAVELGVRVVQILDNIPLDDLTEEQLSAIDARARRLGLSLEVGTRGIAPDHLRAYLRVATRLGSPLVRVVVDTRAHHPEPREVVAALCGVIADFEAAGIDLAIENHDRFDCRTLVGILDDVGSGRLAICLDTVNSLGALERPEIVVEMLGPRTISLHVKDFVVQRASHAMGFVVEGRAAGQGRLDVPWLISELRAMGRDPNAHLELWVPPESTRESTVVKERAWAAASITYLRTLIPG